MTVTAKRNITEMETYSGRYVDLVNPLPEQISLSDIAVGLSNACRFGNQVSRFYSVAEHSVRCAEAVAPAHRLAALFHDAHEAYTGDITAPMKRTLELAAPNALKDLQTRLDIAICAHFGWFSPAELKHPHVKEIDDAIMFREAAGLKYSHGVGHHWGNDAAYEPFVAYGWRPDRAERKFIEMYEALTAF